MRKFFKTNWILLLVIFLLAATTADLVQTGNITVQGGHVLIGKGTIHSNVAVDIIDTNLTGPYQSGVFSEVLCGSRVDSTCDEIRVLLQSSSYPHHIAIGTWIHLLSPTVGVNSGFRKMYGFKIDDITGGDSGNFVWSSGKGKFHLGDTMEVNGLMSYQGGIKYHGALISTSRQIKDTDYVLVGDNSSAIIRDTLPALSSGIGSEYRFFQISNGGAFRWVIYAKPGEKIRTYDSLVLQSNVGIARLQLFNVSNRWEIGYFHQEGTWAATLTGVTATVSDTGWWVQDDLHFSVRIKPLVGTSNTTAMGITGMGSNFTRAGLDTTYVAISAAQGYNNGLPITLVCAMPYSGSAIVCQRGDFTAFTNTGTKGISYGINFSEDFPVTKMPGW